MTDDLTRDERRSLAAIYAFEVRAELRAKVEALPGVPWRYGADDDDMCPNCVTPWKCNGPHVLPERAPDGWYVDRAAVLALLDEG